MRAKFYPYNTTPIDLDNVRLTTLADPLCVTRGGVPTAPSVNTPAPASNLADGSMNNVAEWRSCADPIYRYLPDTVMTGTVNIASVPQTASSFGNALQISRSATGTASNRACRPFDLPPKAYSPWHTQTPHVFTAWVRSANGTPVNARLEISGWIYATAAVCTTNPYIEGCTSFLAAPSTSFTANNTWQQISISWSPPNYAYLGQDTAYGSYQLAIITDTPNQAILIDEATETGPYGYPDCLPIGDPRPGCTTGGPGGPGPCTSACSVGLLLSDSRPTAIHDDAETRCLGLDGADITVVSYGVSCVTFTPRDVLDQGALPVFGSWILVSEDERCATRSDSGLRVAACDFGVTQVFRDRIGNASHRFTLESSNSGLCIKASGPQALLASCDPNDSSQNWTDLDPGSGDPRVDLIVESGTILLAGAALAISQISQALSSRPPYAQLMQNPDLQQLDDSTKVKTPRARDCSSVSLLPEPIIGYALTFMWTKLRLQGAKGAVGIMQYCVDGMYAVRLSANGIEPGAAKYAGHPELVGASRSQQANWFIPGGEGHAESNLLGGLIPITSASSSGWVQIDVMAHYNGRVCILCLTNTLPAWVVNRPAIQTSVDGWSGSSRSKDGDSFDSVPPPPKCYVLNRTHPPSQFPGKPVGFFFQFPGDGQPCSPRVFGPYGLLTY